MKRETILLLFFIGLTLSGCRQGADTIDSLSEAADTFVAEPEDDEEEVPNADYMVPYVEYLRACDMKGCSYDQYAFKLVYIDADTIPEMVISGSCEACGYLVLSQHKGVVAEMRTWRLGFTYIPKSGLCGYANGKQTHFFEHIYKIQNGEFVKIADWDITINDSTWHQTHLLNGMPSTETKAEQMVNKMYYSKGKVVNIDSCCSEGDKWYSTQRLLESM